MVFLIANWIGDADQLFVFPTFGAWSFLFIDGMGSLSFDVLEVISTNPPFNPCCKSEQ